MVVRLALVGGRGSAFTDSDKGGKRAGDGKPFWVILEGEGRFGLSGDFKELKKLAPWKTLVEGEETDSCIGDVGRNGLAGGWGPSRGWGPGEGGGELGAESLGRIGGLGEFCWFCGLGWGGFLLCGAVTAIVVHVKVDLVGVSGFGAGC